MAKKKLEENIEVLNNEVQTSIKGVNIDFKIVGKEAQSMILPEGDYYYADEQLVIKHAPLERIANENGLFVSEVIDKKDHYINKSDFNYAVEAIGYVGEIKYVEVGEATPMSLNSPISQSYPYTMTRKRAVDRLLIKMMGLQGKVYSEVEIEEQRFEAKSKAQSTPQTKPKTEPIKAEPLKVVPTKDEAKKEIVVETLKEETLNEEPKTGASLEDAGEFIVDNFGKYKKIPTKVKDMEESSVQWVLSQDFSKNERMRNVQNMVKTFIGVA